MKQIDFLPVHYHQVAAQQKSKLWRCSVAVLFGSTVAMTAVVQYMWRLDIRQQVTQVESLYATAMAQSQTHSKLQSEYAAAQHDAELYAYLKHPWPRTQLFSQLSSSLPESITLGEIRITQEAKETTAEATLNSAPAITATDPATQAKAIPTEADLKRLRAENDFKMAVMYVSGVAHDATELHEFVASLSHASLFYKAELKSLESDPTAIVKNQETSKFNLRLVIRQGYGQPDGPAAPQLPAAAATAETTSSDEPPANTTVASNPGDAS